MLSAAHYLKVFYGIIKDISILVVDYLFFSQFSSKVFLHNKTVNQQPRISISVVQAKVAISVRNSGVPLFFMRSIIPTVSAPSLVVHVADWYRLTCVCLSFTKVAFHTLTISSKLSYA